jgi:hypothetical protein
MAFKTPNHATPKGGSSHDVINGCTNKAKAIQCIVVSMLVNLLYFGNLCRLLVLFVQS